MERHDGRNALLWTSAGCDSCFDGVNFASKVLKRGRGSKYLEERRGIQQSSIPAQTDDEVDQVGYVIQVWEQQRT